jgi:hypothetical protein
MAPEQADGIELDIRSDIHALGGTLYTLLTARQPFTGPTPMAIIGKVMYEPPPDPRAVVSSVPAEVAALVQRAMAKHRDHRFAIPDDMRRETLRIASGLPTQPTHPASSATIAPTLIPSPAMITPIPSQLALTPVGMHPVAPSVTAYPMFMPVGPIQNPSAAHAGSAPATAEKSKAAIGGRPTADMVSPLALPHRKSMGTPIIITLAVMAALGAGCFWWYQQSVLDGSRDVELARIRGLSDTANDADERRVSQAVAAYDETSTGIRKVIVDAAWSKKRTDIHLARIVALVAEIAALPPDAPPEQFAALEVKLKDLQQQGSDDARLSQALGDLKIKAAARNRPFGKSAPLDAIRGLAIAIWDESHSKANFFAVKRVGDGWGIASRFDYPADADVCVSKVSGFMELQRGRLATNDPKRFSEFGVVDPVDDKSEIHPEYRSDGRSGRGKRVVMTDSSGAILVDMVVGDHDLQSPGACFVREIGSNEVWTAKVNPDLSTCFTDYVEVDPLKIPKDNIRSLMVSDYSIDLSQRTITEHSAISLQKNGDQWVPEGTQPEGEKVAKDVVDKLVTAVTAIKLTDVQPFIMPGRPVQREMKDNGFFFADPSTSPAGSPIVQLDQPAAVVGQNGQLTITTLDGLRYNLLFGNPTLVADEDAAKDTAQKDPPVARPKGRNMIVWVSYDPAFDEVAKQAEIDKAKAEVSHSEAPKGDEKKLSGKERVQQDAKRFAKFYYVINEDDFRILLPARDTLLITAKAHNTATGSTVASAASSSASDAVYRDLKEEDGFEFGAYIASMKYTYGGRPSGVLSSFVLIDNKNGKKYELELVDKNFNNGHISTVLFGDIMVAHSDQGDSLIFSATELQIKKVHKYLESIHSPP